MDVTYSDKVKQWRDQYPLVEDATKRLEEVVGPSSARVKAEWDREEDGLGTSSYRLRVSDGTESVTASFGSAELTIPRQLRMRLLDLWGDLLKARFDEQFRKFKEDGE